MEGYCGQNSKSASLLCRVPYCAMSFSVSCRVVSKDAMSYPEMQCRTRCCNVVPGDAMSYPEMQCRTRRCNVVPGDAILSYPVL